MNNKDKEIKDIMEKENVDTEKYFNGITCEKFKDFANRIESLDIDFKHFVYDYLLKHRFDSETIKKIDYILYNGQFDDDWFINLDIPTREILLFSVQINKLFKKHLRMCNDFTLQKYKYFLPDQNDSGNGIIYKDLKD